MEEVRNTGKGITGSLKLDNTTLSWDYVTNFLIDPCFACLQFGFFL
jgi:hypothetical protein